MQCGELRGVEHGGCSASFDEVGGDAVWLGELMLWFWLAVYLAYRNAKGDCLWTNITI